MLREQQVKLEREIADVQARNSKLSRLVNLSNVEAVEQAEKERDAAKKRVVEEKRKSAVAEKNARDEITKAKRNAKNMIADAKRTIRFWQMAAIGALVIGVAIGWIL